jgi:quercetin dioxygenase-like cupin family protein
VPVRDALPARFRWIALVACALLLAGAAIGWAAHRAAAPEPVVREALAQSTHPKGAKGRTLGLSRVVIQPGAELALHHHQGTQIASIRAGVLTYTVHTGQVKVRRGPADDPQIVKTISAGETGKIKAGQWIVEQPSTHHSAANRGQKPIVIYLATLLRRGAPPSTPG